MYAQSRDGAGRLGDKAQRADAGTMCKVEVTERAWGP